jgi:hypothetical protein
MASAKPALAKTARRRKLSSIPAGIYDRVRITLLHGAILRPNAPRVGRNYADVTDTIREFIRRGVIVRTVINGLIFDGATKDPMQQAVRDSLIAASSRPS